MQTTIRPRGRSEDETATLEKDFFLNLLVVLVLVVGEQGLLANARTAETGVPAVPPQAIRIFIEADGDLHFESLSSPHVSTEIIGHRLKIAAHTRAGERPIPVLIHHDAQTPAGVVYAVLRTVGQVPGTESLLALSHYASLPCEAREEQS